MVTIKQNIKRLPFPIAKPELSNLTTLFDIHKGIFSHKSKSIVFFPNSFVSVACQALIMLDDMPPFSCQSRLLVWKYSWY